MRKSLGCVISLASFSLFLILFFAFMFPTLFGTDYVIGLEQGYKQGEEERNSFFCTQECGEHWYWDDKCVCLQEVDTGTAEATFWLIGA